MKGICFSHEARRAVSLDKYATVLRNMADNCEFQELKNSLIRDPLVFGVTENQARKQLLRVPDLTLDKALDIARAAEATQNQLKQIQNLQEVNVVEKNKVTFPRKKVDGKRTVSDDLEQVDCKFWGWRHVRDKTKCPAYGHQCTKCGRNSHFAVMCRGGKLPYDRSGGHQNLHYVDDFDQSSLEEYTTDVITHHITAVEHAKSCPKQLFTSDSKDVTFQLDCGATCNLLPLKIFSSIMGNPQDLYFKRRSATLKMYNGSTMSPLGKCTLRCTKGEVRKDVDFFIVDEDVRPLLGAKTCQELNFIKVMVNDIPNSETVNSVNVKCRLERRTRRASR